MVDRMIAAVAWRTNASLLAIDADLRYVARVTGINLDDASLQFPWVGIEKPDTLDCDWHKILIKHDPYARHGAGVDRATPAP